MVTRPDPEKQKDNEEENGEFYSRIKMLNISSPLNHDRFILFLVSLLELLVTINMF